MSRESAKARFDREPNDPAKGYLRATDAQAAVDDIYNDLEAVQDDSLSLTDGGQVDGPVTLAGAVTIPGYGLGMYLAGDGAGTLRWQHVPKGDQGEKGEKGDTGVATATAPLSLTGSTLSLDTSGFATATQGGKADGAAQKAANLSDLASASEARTNLGLGSAAVLDAATGRTAGAGQVVKGNDGRFWPRIVRQSPLAASTPIWISPAGARAASGANWNDIYVLFSPIWLPAGTIDRVAMAITTAGAGGTTVMLGLYADADPSGQYTWPSNLLYNFGTINGASATVQEITLDPITIAEGWYWVASLLLGGSTCQFRCISAATILQVATSNVNQATSLLTTSVSGAYLAIVVSGSAYTTLPEVATAPPPGASGFSFITGSLGPNIAVRYSALA